MARRRFFVDSIREGTAELRGDDALHLTRVLRVEAGQQFEISDNEAAWLAEVVEAKGPRVLFRTVEPIASAPLPVTVTLVAALVKFDRFDWIVEKSTELGISRLLPMNTARTEKGLYEASHKRSERWLKIAREASQQSRRLTIPEILPAAAFGQCLKQAAEYRYFLDEAGAPPFLPTLPAGRNPSDRVALLLGPEGGWTDNERQLAAAAGWQPVSLGPLVLRAETAAAAALAVVNAAWSVKE